MEDFEKNTINPGIFQIDNVENDNACFYRALANYVYFATPHDKQSSLKRYKACSILTTLLKLL